MEGFMSFPSYEFTPADADLDLPTSAALPREHCLIHLKRIREMTQWTSQ
jgi:hypothetical protein